MACGARNVTLSQYKRLMDPSSPIADGIIGAKPRRPPRGQGRTMSTHLDVGSLHACFSFSF